MQIYRTARLQAISEIQQTLKIKDIPSNTDDVINELE